MSRLTAFLGIRAGESRPLVLASAINFLVMLGLSLARSGRDTLFYIEIGSRYLPLMFVFNALFAVGVNEVYGYFVGKYEQHRLYLRTVILFLVAAIGILCLVLMRHWIPDSALWNWVYYGGIFVLTEAIAIILVVATANFVNDPAFFDLSAIKRLAPYYVSCGHFGSIISGLIATFFVADIGLETLFWIWVASLIMTLAISSVAVRMLYGRSSVLSGEVDSGGGFWSTSSMILNTPYLRWFLIVTILNFFLGAAYEWILATNAERAVTQMAAVEFSADKAGQLTDNTVVEAGLVHYLGMVYIGGGTFALFFQLFFMGSIIRRFGVAKANFGAPLVLALGAVGLVFNANSMVFAVIARGSFILAENAFNQTLIRFVYNVIREKDRLRVQAFIESNVISITIALTGGLLLIFSLASVLMPYFGFLVAVAAGGMLWFTWLMKGAYEKEARKNYNKLSSFGQQELMRDMLSSDSADAKRFVQFLKAASEPRSLIHAIGVIAREKLTTHREEFVIASLSDGRPTIKTAAIRAIAELPEPDGLIQLTTVLRREQNPVVVAAALRACRSIVSHDELDLDEFREFLNTEHAEVLSSAIALLWENAGMEGSESVLEKYRMLSTSNNPRDRVLLAYTLGELNKTRDLLKLLDFTNNKDGNESQIAVLTALGRIGNLQPASQLLKDVMERLFVSLRSLALRDAAQSALARLALQFPGEVIARFRDAQIPVDERRSIALVLSRMPRQSSRQAGTDSVSEALASALFCADFSLREAAAHSLAVRAITEGESVGLSWDIVQQPFMEVCSTAVRLRAAVTQLRRNVVGLAESPVMLLHKHVLDLCHRYTVHAFDLLTTAFPDDNIPALFLNLQSPRTHAKAIEVLENLRMPRRDFARLFALFDTDAFSAAIRDTDGIARDESNAVRQLLASDEIWTIRCLAHAYSRPPFRDHAAERTAIEQKSREFDTERREDMSEVIEKVDKLARAPIFEHVPIDHLYELAERATERTFLRNEELFSADDPEPRIVVLTEGQAMIVKTDKSGHQPVQTVTAPYTLNEIAAFDIESSGFSAVALTDAACLTLAASEVRDLLRIQPELSRHFMQALGRRLVLAYDDLLRHTNLGNQLGKKVEEILNERFKELDAIGKISDNVERLLNSRPEINVRLSVEDLKHELHSAVSDACSAPRMQTHSHPK